MGQVDIYIAWLGLGTGVFHSILLEECHWALMVSVAAYDLELV